MNNKEYTREGIARAVERERERERNRIMRAYWHKRRRQAFWTPRYVVLCVALGTAAFCAGLYWFLSTHFAQ